MRTRTLTLKKETLVELATTDLAQVVGALSGLSCTACGSDFRACEPPTIRCAVTVQGCFTSLNVC